MTEQEINLTLQQLAGRIGDLEVRSAVVNTQLALAHEQIHQFREAVEQLIAECGEDCAKAEQIAEALGVNPV